MTQTSKTLPIALALALLAAAGLSACNTVRGAGQDVEAAGSAVARTATDMQQDLNDGDPNTP